MSIFQRKHVKLAVEMMNHMEIDAFSPFNLYYALVILAQLCLPSKEKHTALCKFLNLSTDVDLAKIAKLLNLQTSDNIDLLAYISDKLEPSYRFEQLAKTFNFQIIRSPANRCSLISSFIMNETWTVPFKKHEDKPINFGGIGVIPMMNSIFDHDSIARFNVNGSAATFRLKCNSGREFCLVVPLTTDFTQVDALKQLDQPALITNKLQRLHVYMPQFEIDVHNKYNDVFRILGLNDLFEVGSGDLDVFSNEEGYVDRISQKTKVTVDHEGVRIKDDVEIDFGVGGCYRQMQKVTRTTTTIVCNRHFYWALFEPKYANIYAFGRYKGPTKYSLKNLNLPLVDTVQIVKDIIEIDDDDDF